MSINQHYSSEHSQPQWWPQTHYMMDSSSSSSPDLKPSFCNNQMFSSTRNGTSFDLNNDDDEDRRSTTAHDGEEDDLPKERLFEKPLTPSDVGKLNRLVIPKQHAEKHFPLNGGSAEPGENGLLLGFEDEAGKSWRFRYSYWNSSQSYVLTKGWSRFVKEKRLDAGDIVVFARHRLDTGRLFIGWRRRNSAGGCVSQPAAAAAASGAAGWARSGFYPGQYAYPGQHLQSAPVPFSSMPYQSESIHAGGAVVQEQQLQQSQTGSGNSKRLRLFGVNLECYESEEAVGSPMSTQGPAQTQAHHHYNQYYSNHHMDIGFSGGGADVYRQG